MACDIHSINPLVSKVAQWLINVNLRSLVLLLDPLLNLLVVVKGYQLLVILVVPVLFGRGDDIDVVLRTLVNLFMIDRVFKYV